ncbi:MAG TPA: sialate O-acetylesterase, partial [Planctomycetes bacterium]|nr:sialate O-acetylesterase [Planctomycetota bacterium]HIN80871.1 sialate O-acetylesterase [Planctomycetota bacterium]
MTRSSAASPIVLLLVLFFCSPAVAVDVPAVFSDHMVLQRGQEVPVWGHASPGAKISVRFAGQKADTFTDADGNWEIRLEPLE